MLNCVTILNVYFTFFFLGVSHQKSRPKAIREAPVLNFGPDTAIFCGFPQSFHANAEVPVPYGATVLEEP
jgi:hypothetical protein